METIAIDNKIDGDDLGDDEKTEEMVKKEAFDSEMEHTTSDIPKFNDAYIKRNRPGSSAKVYI